MEWIECFAFEHGLAGDTIVEPLVFGECGSNVPRSPICTVLKSPPLKGFESSRVLAQDSRDLLSEGV